MSMKPLMDDLRITPATGAAGNAAEVCANAAAFNTQFATAMDTAGFESNMMMLSFADLDNVVNYVFTMYESDTQEAVPSATMTVVVHSQMRVQRHDGSQTLCPATTAVLSLTQASDEDNIYLFEYFGVRRFILLVASGVANVNIQPNLTWIQANPRRGPTHAVGYGGP